MCYDKLETDFQVLKPYVCDDKLCTYQYYSLNRGPSLEVISFAYTAQHMLTSSRQYEICAKPHTVDLLVSLAYSAAFSSALNDFPVGMNLRVPSKAQDSTLCDFDTLLDADVSSVGIRCFTIVRLYSHLVGEQKCKVILSLLDSLPSVPKMKKFLERRSAVGTRKQRLKDIDATVLPAAWQILRW